MTDEEFERLATLYGFAPSRPLREMLDAAVKAGARRVLRFWTATLTFAPTI